MIAPTPSPTASPVNTPSTSPSTAPSSTPPTPATVPTGSTETLSAGNADGTTNSAAIAIVGIASTIIVCALAVYASDMRERRLYDKRVKEHGHQDVVDDNSSQKSAFRSRVGGESQTSAGSMHGSHTESGYWVHARVASTNSTELVEYEGGGNPQNMLPPMLADEARAEEPNNALALTRIPDDASISRVSTLTMSLKEQSRYSYGADIEEKLSRYAIESSSHVTELDDAHRVSDDTKLTSLVKGGMAAEDASVCSSLTNGSSAQLLGEDCLDVKFHQTPEGTPFASLEVSPDTPHEEEYDVEMHASDVDDDDFTIDSHEQANGNELAQLEQLLAGIPFDEMSQGTPTGTDDDDDDDAKDVPMDTDSNEKESGRDVYVRDVCFVPYLMEGKVSLGLELFDATSEESFPTVATLDLDGPLIGQVLIGDAIIAVNEKDTSGLSSEETMKLLEFQIFHAGDMETDQTTKMIKMTVMSPGTDEGSLSDDQQSIDLESATEI